MEPNRKIPHLVYWGAKSLVSICLKLAFRWQIKGIENVPVNGAVVFGSNHISNFDPMIVGASTKRQVRFMAKEELFKNRFLGAVLWYLGAFQVKRGARDTAAIRYAIQIPHRGGCIVIFPEGHRSRDGHLGKGMPGVALIARKSEAPIVPVAVVGPYRFRKQLTVRFGEPLYPDPADTNDSLLEKLMCRISELLKAGHAQ